MPPRRLDLFGLLGLATLVVGCETSTDYLPCAIERSSPTPRGDLPPPAIGPCDVNGWCWENPLPFRDGLGPIFHRRDVTVISSAHGHLLRLRDGVWEALPPLPKPPTITGSVDAADVFAVDELVYVAGQIGIDGFAWRYDGSTWAMFEFGRDFGPVAIGGTARDELRIVGRGGAKRWTGREFVDVATPRAVGQAVWGCRGDYVGGFFQGSFVDEELVLARGKDAFEKAAELPSVNVQVHAIDGSALDDVFVAGFPNGGTAATVWRYDGNVVEDVAIAGAYAVTDIVALGGGDAIATGSAVGGTGGSWRREAGAWAAIGTQGFDQLEAAAGDDMLARTSLTIHQFDGATFRAPFPMPLAHPLNAEQFVGVYATATLAPIVVANDAVYRRTADDFVLVPTPPLSFRSFRGVFGRGDSDVFVFGDDGWLLRGDGTSFSEHTIPPGEFAGDITAGFALAANAVFVGTSSGKLFGFDGITFAEVASTTNDIVGVHAFAANDVWALDASGNVVHFDGNQWLDSTLAAGSVTALGLAGAGGVLFAITSDTLYRNSGAGWTPTAVMTPATLTAIAASGADEAVIVGTNGRAFHVSGAGVSDISADVPWSLRAVTYAGAELFAAGDLGTVLRHRAAE